MQAKHNGLPVYVISYDEDMIFNNVSLVEFPAIGRDFLKFSNDESLCFSIVEDQRIVTGPVMIPDRFIYRCDSKRGEYYIKASTDTIKNMAIEFFRTGRENEGNVEHSTSVKGVTFFESYLKDSGRNVAPTEFSDLPDGTWFMSAKIENEDLWKMIKDGDIKGFSIDVLVAVEPEDKDAETISTLDEFFDYINELK